jgi:hypothetical protein
MISVARPARVRSPEPSTISLAPNKYVRVIAPGVDIQAKLTTEQVAKLIAFTLELIAPPAGYNGPG